MNDLDDVVAEYVRAIEAGDLTDEEFNQLPSDIRAAVEQAMG
jgi:hypothetical protein